MSESEDISMGGALRGTAGVSRLGNCPDIVPFALFGAFTLTLLLRSSSTFRLGAVMNDVSELRVSSVFESCPDCSDQFSMEVLV